MEDPRRPKRRPPFDKLQRWGRCGAQIRQPPVKLCLQWDSPENLDPCTWVSSAPETRYHPMHCAEQTVFLKDCQTVLPRLGHLGGRNWNFGHGRSSVAT